MAHHYEGATVSEVLPRITRDLLERGYEVGSRNGRVKEFLNTQIVITDPQRREVLTLNRKANVFAQIAETMWVLSGRNDIEWLSAYLPRAVDYSDDGQTWRAGYGPRIRSWPGRNFSNTHDQLAYVVDTLRADPLSRQAVIAIWDPSVDTTPGKDKACNTFLQFQSRLGALHLTVNVRSNDVMWGWSGINAFEWSTVQEIVAHLLGIAVGDLTFNIGSLHLYEPHWNKGANLEHEESNDWISPFFLPDGMDRSLQTVDRLVVQWFDWERRCRDENVTQRDYVEVFSTEVSLFGEWAIAIAYYWTRDEMWLRMLRGTALATAITRAPASVLLEAPQTSHSSAGAPGHNLGAHERTRAFYKFATHLHAQKHASYGGSWKKRGEQLSILANIARKVDRLGVGDEYDSSADTLVDLLIYLIKYECWLNGSTSATPEQVNPRLSHYLAVVEEVSTEGQAFDITYSDIASDFDRYADALPSLDLGVKLGAIHDLIVTLTPVARDVWYDNEQHTEVGAS